MISGTDSEKIFLKGPESGKPIKNFFDGVEPRNACNFYQTNHINVFAFFSFEDFVNKNFYKIYLFEILLFLPGRDKPHGGI